MKIADIPSKIPVPFAKNAGGPYIRTIPQTTGTAGAASFDQGFPPNTFSTGYPAGKDFNGILNIISAWIRWGMSGAPSRYDSAFSTGIGGYPLGAVLPSTTAGVYWRSTADDNTTDPDGGSPVNWVPAYNTGSFMDQSITRAKIADAAVGSIQIENESIVGGDIAPNTVNDGNLVQVPTKTVKGRVLAGTGAPANLSPSDIVGMLYTVTTNANGTCRQWADGYKEQSGAVLGVAADATATVTFPVPFANAPGIGEIKVSLHKGSLITGQDNSAEHTGSATTTTMQVSNNQAAGGGAADISWSARGY